MMSAEVKDRAIFVKRLLRTIPVMVIPVHNQDALQTILFLEITGGDGHIVENEETHAPGRRCGVSGWPSRSEGILDLSLHHGIHNVEDATSREFGGLQRAG